MNNSRYTIIANWKMYFSYRQTQYWLEQHAQELITRAKSINFVLCSSYENLNILLTFLKESTIQLGGQNCSEHSLGAHTGQVSAQSLKEMEISYCLIGHAETRAAFNETNAILYKKLEQLITYDIVPLFCIGESKEIFEKKATSIAIKQQLEPLFLLLDNAAQPLKIIIAYEPIWAIGTNAVVPNDYVMYIINVIKELMKPYWNYHTIQVAYGGSVSSLSLVEIKKIPELRTFLIGKASTDFQELKKIISLLT